MYNKGERERERERTVQKNEEAEKLLRSYIVAKYIPIFTCWKDITKKAVIIN